MSERYTAGYEQLEKELIDESIDRFIHDKSIEAMMFEHYEQDPRAAASVRTAEIVGFSLEAGQYVDLLDK